MDDSEVYKALIMKLKKSSRLRSIISKIGESDDKSLYVAAVKEYIFSNPYTFGISRDGRVVRENPLKRVGNFINKYIFPGLNYWKLTLEEREMLEKLIQTPDLEKDEIQRLIEDVKPSESIDEDRRRLLKAMGVGLGALALGQGAQLINPTEAEAAQQAFNNNQQFDILLFVIHHYFHDLTGKQIRPYPGAITSGTGFVKGYDITKTQNGLQIRPYPGAITSGTGFVKGYDIN
ncbi:hypothetical protein C0585_04575 [Candidatus Woesearchaeota archaeon]|nr:MAG: hypothetical protein C0585_04575 [Candidatus Woesearchaeota archaeon]